MTNEQCIDLKRHAAHVRKMLWKRFILPVRGIRAVRSLWRTSLHTSI